MLEIAWLVAVDTHMRIKKAHLSDGNIICISLLRGFLLALSEQAFGKMLKLWSRHHLSAGPARENLRVLYIPEIATL